MFKDYNNYSLKVNYYNIYFYYALIKNKSYLFI